MTHGSRSLGRGLFAAALLVAVFIGSRGITDEGAMPVRGDMPRYLMNGVFLYDFLGSGVGWTFGSAMTYAQRYFAQYPALSIGHHAPLLPISLVPFYRLVDILFIFREDRRCLHDLIAGTQVVVGDGASPPPLA